MLDKTHKDRLTALLALMAATLGAYALYHLIPATTASPAHADAASPVLQTAPASQGGGQALLPAGAPAPVQAAVAPVSSQAGPVSLTARADRGAVVAGQEGIVHVALEMRAAADTAAAAARKPTDMLVVLDISGSMSGPKLRHAKQALHELIDRLTPEDRFSLVTYESDARLLVPFARASRHDKRRFHTVASSLGTAGGTNMSAGLDLALRELTKSRRAGRSARVLLLSDGHANEGDSTPAGLLSRARRVVQLEDVMSTMGVGDDFNEDLMTALADRGTGNFYYLSRVETLARFFDAELRAAAATVASAVKLRFDPAAGVELLDLSGYPVDRTGGLSSVHPGNLYAGQERTLWATLRVPTGRAGEVPVGRFSLQYRGADAVHTLSPPDLPALACVTDEHTFERAIDKPLWEEYVAGEAYQRAQAALGSAIGEGNAADVERERADYASNRALADKLGSARVLQRLADMEHEAEEAKAQQQAPTRMRKRAAKQKKARSLFKRRADAYNDDPLAGLEGL